MCCGLKNRSALDSLFLKEAMWNLISAYLIVNRLVVSESSGLDQTSLDEASHLFIVR